MSDLSKVAWNIRREGHAWQGEESRRKYYLAPEKIELFEGKIFFDDERRLTMLALLLENVGVDAAVRLGNPAVWREAVAHLDEPE